MLLDICDIWDVLVIHTNIISSIYFQLNIKDDVDFYLGNYLNLKSVCSYLSYFVNIKRLMKKRNVNLRVIIYVYMYIKIVTNILYH